MAILDIGDRELSRNQSDRASPMIAEAPPMHSVSKNNKPKNRQNGLKLVGIGSRAGIERSSEAFCATVGFGASDLVTVKLSNNRI